MDKDVTGLQSTLNAWLPTKVNQTIEPVISNAEKTLTRINGNITTGIANKINAAMVSSAKIDSKIGNQIADKIIPLEANRDVIERNIIDKIDLKLLPLEANMYMRGRPLEKYTSTTSIAASSTKDGPIQVPPGTTCPSGTQLIDSGTRGGAICVPIGEPPPPIGSPPPPPPPSICIPMSIYVRHCMDKVNTCVYAVPDSWPSLSNDDIQFATGISCDAHLVDYLAAAQNYCSSPGFNIGMCSKPPTTPVPGGGNVCCPPAVIQNIIQPAPVTTTVYPSNIQPIGGGQLQNNPILFNPIMNITIPPPQVIQNYPTPTVTFPSPTVPISGTGQPSGQSPQPQCFPEGDMAYYLQECNDNTKLQALQKELGTDFTAPLQGKSLMEYMQSEIDNNLSDTKFIDIIITQSNGSLR